MKINASKTTCNASTETDSVIYVDASVGTAAASTATVDTQTNNALVDSKSLSHPGTRIYDHKVVPFNYVQ
ncbi:hypothetical protein Bhyg_07883 [Pseudolycoriella hygida]|uniref:Uncharacterized protein n=1 Tax=Pseudolycoriella hygida TaxID=35572 RepID=A0A9Q0S2F1_9DIPT|nr:hypothetical protein Bhyg_07883 [Pseudolycoriella hygida]